MRGNPDLDSGVRNYNPLYLELSTLGVHILLTTTATTNNHHQKQKTNTSQVKNMVFISRAFVSSQRETLLSIFLKCLNWNPFYKKTVCHIYYLERQDKCLIGMRHGGSLGLLKPVPFLGLRNDYKGVCRKVRLQEAGGGGETGEPS